MIAPTLSKPLKLPLSEEDLDTINAYLRTLTPEEILRWSIEHITDLYQTTAFGLTGLVATDMLSKIFTLPPSLIFLDTLYHFPETYELVEVVKARYSIPVIVYKPEGCATVQEFENKYGERLWERNEGLYDYVVKVGTGTIAVIIGAKFENISFRWNLQGARMRNSA
jgi:phosphoadenosine phosphosulfate reductase